MREECTFRHCLKTIFHVPFFKNLWKNVLYQNGSINQERHDTATGVSHGRGVNRLPERQNKVRSKRINLEGNTHAQEINVSQCPV
jgi:hypothetical protein